MITYKNRQRVVKSWRRIRLQVNIGPAICDMGVYCLRGIQIFEKRLPFYHDLPEQSLELVSSLWQKICSGLRGKINSDGKFKSAVICRNNSNCFGVTKHCTPGAEMTIFFFLLKKKKTSIHRWFWLRLQISTPTREECFGESRPRWIATIIREHSIANKDLCNDLQDQWM